MFYFIFNIPLSTSNTQCFLLPVDNGSCSQQGPTTLAKLESQGLLSFNPPRWSPTTWPYFLSTEVLFSQKGRFLGEYD